MFAIIVTLVTCLIRGYFRNNKGEGIFPYVVLIFVVAVPGYMVSSFIYYVSTNSSLGKMAFVTKTVNDPQCGPVCVLRRDKVRLFEHYRNLIQRQKACEAYKSKLLREKTSMSDSGAITVINKEVNATDSELNTLKVTLQSIEDLACRVYFAQFMSNLGANISSSELNGEMDRLIIRASRITRELEKTAQGK